VPFSRSFLALVAALLASGHAFADSVSLPVLGASTPRAQIETALGFVVPRAEGDRLAPVSLQTVQFETNLSDDAYRVGVRYGVGAAALASRSPLKTAMAPSNLTVWFRAQNVTAHGLSFSSGVALSLPTAWVSIGGPADDALRSTRSLRLDQRNDFVARGLAISPHIDVRVSISHLDFQLRQTLDVSTEVSARALQSTTATSVLFAGTHYRTLNPGIELVHLYTLDAAQANDSRSRWTLFPHVKLSLPKVEPYLGLVYGAPASHPKGEAMFAVRVGFNFLF
jgi:hypothetical protein